MRRLLIILALLLTGSSRILVAADAAPVLDKERTVVIKGVLTGQNLGGVAYAMVAMAKADATKPIDIIISSPGGELVSGFMFLSVLEGLKAEGVRLRCYVPTIAASMAFQIYTHCDERYALDHSFLLWHRVRTTIRDVVTAPLAAELAKDLQKTDDLIFDDLKATLGADMSEQDIRYHFERETLHNALQLHEIAPHFLTVYKAIPGLVALMTDESVPGVGNVSKGVSKPKVTGPTYIAPEEIIPELLRGVNNHG